MTKIISFFLFFSLSFNVFADFSDCNFNKRITASLKNGTITDSSFATISDAIRALITSYGSDFVKSYSDSGNSNTVTIVLKDQKTLKNIGNVVIETVTFCKGDTK